MKMIVKRSSSDMIFLAPGDEIIEINGIKASSLRSKALFQCLGVDESLVRWTKEKSNSPLKQKLKVRTISCVC